MLGFWGKSKEEKLANAEKKAQKKLEKKNEKITDG